MEILILFAVVGLGAFGWAVWSEYTAWRRIEPRDRALYHWTRPSGPPDTRPDHFTDD